MQHSALTTVGVRITELDLNDVTVPDIGKLR